MEVDCKRERGAEVRERIMVGMSGGVDSSVAALLLREAGAECVGVTMEMLPAGSPAAEEARAAAEKLGMEHHVFSAAARFEQKVIRPFVETYERGGTPNPCIECNRTMKFSYLYDLARAHGCSAVATGHYARIGRREDGRWLLKKGLDEEKDQSYFLYVLTQEMLAHSRFPLGELTKEAVRALAEQYGLLNAHKRDSQDICFVPDGDYERFIRRYTGKDYPQGDFVDEDGRPLGRHRGIIGYTVGQRRGLGISAKKPLYVCCKVPEENAVCLAEEAALYSRVLFAKNINLIAAERLEGPVRCAARIRYRHREQPATAVQLDEDTLRVEFDEPQRAITPGQSAVLYLGDVVLGGGIIYEPAEGEGEK